MLRLSSGKIFFLVLLASTPSFAQAKQRETLVCDFENTKKEIVLEGGKRLLEKSRYFVVVSGPRAVQGLKLRGMVSEKKIELNAEVLIPMESLFDGSIADRPAMMYLYSRRGEVLITYISLDPQYLPISFGTRGSCEILGSNGSADEGAKDEDPAEAIESVEEV